MEPVRCGVLGLGMIGAVHAEILATLPGAEVVAACDTDPSTAERIPVSARFATEAAEMLDPDLIEAVWICTPEEQHREHVEMALAAGLAVLCEKPIAGSVADARAIEELAVGAGTPFAIGHQLRFDPRYSSVHEAAADGRLGKLSSVMARRIVPNFEGRQIHARTTLAREVGVHDLDVLRWIGGPIERVYAEEARTAIVGTDAVDAIVSTIGFESGAVGALELGWASPAQTGLRSDYRLSAFGSKGGAFIELRDEGVAVFSEAGTTFPRSSGALAAEDQAFIRMVRGGPEWPLEVEDAIFALAAAIAIDTSIAESRPVELAEGLDAARSEGAR